MAGDFADYEMMFGKAARKECLEVAKDIVEEIQRSPLTPVLTGKLKRGYKAKKSDLGAEVTTAVAYWHFIEYGTKNMAAQAHVRPSLEIVRIKRRT